MDGVEGPQGRRKWLSGPGNHGPTHLHDLDLLEKAEHRFSPDREITIGQPLAKTHPVERAQALDLDQCARDALSNGFPLLEPISLAETIRRRTDESRYAINARPAAPPAGDPRCLH